jgi:AAA15 family ATPase/GTPase
VDKEGVLMLIDFSVSNYKSFREQQELSLMATSDKEHVNDNTFEVTGQRLLKSVALYGANASGKTNLLSAIWFMRQFVLSSANNQAGNQIPVTVFKLDSRMQAKPSKFEVMFMLDTTRYKYVFEVDKVRVINEWLYAYKTARPQLWFKRVFDLDKKEYVWKFGNNFKGQMQSWKEQTLENTLFLSRASQLNSEQLKPLYQWFKNLFVLNTTEQLNPDYTAKWCKDSDLHNNKVLSFLKTSGDNNGIVGISIKEEEITDEKIHPDIKWLVEGLKTRNKEGKLQKRTISMLHKLIDSNDSIMLNFSEEAAGTRKLFSLAMFWLQAIQDGRILIIDELNNSLHPILAKFLIRLFHDEEINKHGAQLIFTGHDSFLLDLEIFRRDQIWFTEKTANQNTALYSLAEYSPRKNESIEKGYLKGRYGAVPYIDETILS